MNAGKYKLMFGGSCGKMIVNSGKWPCDICRKGVRVKVGFIRGAVVCVVTCRG